MPTLTVELSDELYGFVMQRKGETPDETVGRALCFMEFEERFGRAGEPETEEELAAIQALLDEGEASGVYEGDVFADLRAEFHLPERRN
jgi:hypothetical protein